MVDGGDLRLRPGGDRGGLPVRLTGPASRRRPQLHGRGRAAAGLDRLLPAKQTRGRCKDVRYHRAGVLSAFVNALTLIVLSLWIFYEAVLRLRSPEPVHETTMIVIA